MDRYAAELRQRLAPKAPGTYVRARGQSLLVGCGDPDAAGDDRLKLDRVLGSARFSLKVRLASGRWESTHMGGTLAELVEFATTVLPHYLSPWPDAPRTSETRH